MATRARSVISRVVEQVKEAMPGGGGGTTATAAATGTVAGGGYEAGTGTASNGGDIGGNEQ